MGKKVGAKRKKSTRGKKAATRDLATRKGSSVGRGDVTGGATSKFGPVNAGKTFLIFGGSLPQ